MNSKNPTPTAWQTIDGVTWLRWRSGGPWSTPDGVWTLRLDAIDDIDGYYLTGPFLDYPGRWMSIGFVESAKVAARIIKP